jgi:hemerythrin superfamily protein
MGIIRRLLGKEVTTDVLELLAEQHAEVDALIAKLENGEGNRRVVFSELADKLAAHAVVEEKLFYPAVLAKDTEGMLAEAVEEHLSIKRVLADMIAARIDDDHFLAKLSVLKEQVSHHAHAEEEKELFPKVRDMFSADERAALGNELLVMFEDLLATHPMRSVPSQTGSAAQLPRLRGRRMT